MLIAMSVSSLLLLGALFIHFQAPRGGSLLLPSGAPVGHARTGCGGRRTRRTQDGGHAVGSRRFRPGGHPTILVGSKNR